MTKRRSKRSRKPAARSPADSAAGRTNVLLEDVQRQLKVVAEGVAGVQQTIDSNIDAGLKDIRFEVGVLKSVVEVNSKHIVELRTDVSTLKTDVSTLKTDVAVIKGQLVDINSKLDRKADTSQVDALDVRVTALEAG